MFTSIFLFHFIRLYCICIKQTSWYPTLFLRSLSHSFYARHPQSEIFLSLLWLMFFYSFFAFFLLCIAFTCSTQQHAFQSIQKMAAKCVFLWKSIQRVNVFTSNVKFALRIVFRLCGVFILNLKCDSYFL